MGKEQFNIIRETRDFLVVDKPAMMVCQSDTASDPTLLDLVQAQFPNDKLHLLTRIDQPVSGLVLLSRNKAFVQEFTRLQETKKVVKTYLAIVEGQWKHEESMFKHFITKNQKRRRAFVNDQGKGKAIESEINLLSALDRYSLLKVSITSGKFHQIRAHLSFLEHAIKGDVKYGARRKNKDRYILLHSKEISFDYKGQPITLTANPPENDPLWNIALNAID